MVAHVTGSVRYPFNVRCDYCGVLYTLYIDPQDYVDWCNDNGFIQDLMPYLADGERELLISKTCGSCFDEMFTGEEDE